MDRVMSIFSAFNLESSPDGFSVEELIPQLPETSAEVAALKTRIRDNDLAYGTLVAEDFRSLAFIGLLQPSYDIDDNQLRDDVEHLVETTRTAGYEVYASGLPMTRSYIALHMGTDMRRFLPYGIIIMILLLAISFRSWMGVFLPLMIVIMSILWTFGFMAVFGIKFTFVAMLIPVMLIAIANDYGIHIIARYFESIRSDPQIPKRERIIEVMRSLGMPIFLAGITTIVGFLSLLSHVLVDASKVAVMASFGIFVAFILSLGVIPAAILLLRIPRVVENGNQDRRFDGFLRGWVNFFTRNARWVLSGSVIVLIIIGLGIPKIVVDTDPNHYYKVHDPVRVNNEKIGELFGGSTQLSVMVEGDIKSPEILNEMITLSEFIESHRSVSNVMSIADMITRMNEAFHGGDSTYRVIPENRNLVAQYLLLYSFSGDASDLDRYVDYDYEKAQIIVRIDRVSTTEINDLINDIEAYVDEHHDRSVFTAVTGFATIMGILIHLLVIGQTWSLAISVCMVFIITALIFRSIKGGLVASVPLSMAMVLVFGLMGYAKIELNAATAMLSSIMVGVGVDYTIHFLWHLRESIREGLDLEEAIQMTMLHSGKGIIYNALSVLVGFSVLLLSTFLPITFFGFLIVFSIGMCLFGALAILPALVVLTRPRFLLDAIPEKGA
ncbi:MAG: MMPL family transporter, partial [Candidatus Marinimicrobia bacterium]|nr:MMPL family transporter [Candidatus Neomarinimicrobiota bacterium]